MKQKLTFLLTLLLATTLVQAQVTIGSGEKPNLGALLDLKDDGTYNNGETASKGLGLPRVELKNLMPTNPAELSASIGSTGDWNLTEHTGLLVYNAKKNGNICPGIHIWDGTTWVALSGGSKPDITMTDGDGNVYAAKWFSADPCDPAAAAAGAYWTTSNLYATKDKNGAAFTGGARLNPGKCSTSDGAIIINSTGDFTGNVAYGQSATAPSGTTPQPMQDYAAKFGLSYTHAQARLACPASWSLPDDPAWDALALAHGGTAVAGAAMRANNDYFLSNDNSTTSYKWGLYDAAGTTLSGFNALPSGSVLADGAYASHFSDTAYWWSASTSGSYRYMYYNNSDLNSYPYDSGYYSSVRCVKK